MDTSRRSRAGETTRAANGAAGLESFMAKKKSKREYVWLECTECRQRNYRTEVSVAEGTPKLQLKKFCKTERKHTVHKLRRK